ncbi:MAG: DUF3108 domain-containing protein [Woeseiaceae bacterium]
MKQASTATTPRRWLAAILLASAACAASPVLAAMQLTPHSAEYKVRINVVSGQLSTNLKLTADGYIATHAIAPTGVARIFTRGSIEESSTFISSDAGVIPVAYQSNDSLSRDKDRVDVRFDWHDNVARGTVNGKKFETTLQGLSHDRISIQYQLMHDLLNDSPDKQYQLFDVDKMKSLNIRTLGSREVNVGAGTFTAVGIQHQTENSSRVTTLWCVKALDYLPVIIEQHRNGKLRVQATLESYSPLVADAPGNAE